jgi:hypothetical protein
VAVGWFDGASNTETLAESWNGSSWMIDPTPNGPSGSASQLSAVACTSPSACTAVGYYVTAAGNSVPLTEQWNGTTWFKHVASGPPGDPYAQLTGVACTTADACTAVGTTGNGGYVTTPLDFADNWNGSSWTYEAVPSPPSAVVDESLNAISRSGSTAFTAVGYFSTYALAPRTDQPGTPLVTLAERLAG